MNTLKQGFIAALALTAGAVLAAAPAEAKIYNVVFAGKTIQVDCPSSPEGQTMTWVNQNCTALSVGTPGGATAHPRSNFKVR